MTTNILLGIGGTGAKIVESTLFLLSAGIGPKPKVIVGLVDQDNANGNVVRTLRLISLLRNLRADFSKENKIDWNSPESEGGTSLLSIDVEPLLVDADQTHWRPAPDNMPTLRHILRHQDMADDEKALFDLLFRDESARPADAEQTMSLAEGYRGRAHVGASALLAALHHDQPEFLARLTELMRNSSTGGEVRIFIAGSLFGGTGAAGFPTIARSLNNLRAADNKEKIDGKKVRLGGSLMLPYFMFREPSADSDANVITAGQLLPQARIAIEYYERMLQQEGVFDRLYIAGWDEMFDLPYHQAGGGDQQNPPLLPELAAAMAAVDFFTLEDCKREAAPLVCARRRGEEFGWADLPAHGDLKKTFYERLGSAIRFALWWLYRVEPAIDDRSMLGRINLPWLNKLSRGTDWKKDTPEARENMISYVKALLQWAAAMQLFSKSLLNKFTLWNPDSFSQGDVNKPTDPIILQSTRREDQTLADIDTILHPSDEVERPVGARQLYEDLFLTLSSDKHAGFGRVVAGVHKAAQPFRKKA